MREEINFYCDESCHLENDKQKAMVMGAVYCPLSKKNEIFSRISEIKEKHNLDRNFEIKWNKVGSKKLDFYLDIIDYFFDDDDLSFRGLVVPDKSKLDHKRFSQTHDDFYYKMYFDLLKVVLNTQCSNNIYLDIKDTKSRSKVLGLRDFLRSVHYDTTKRIVKKIQEVRSDEVSLLQVTDLLIGALSYLHRGLNTSEAKLELIRRIKERSGLSLIKNTWLTERKVNLLIWDSSYRS